MKNSVKILASAILMTIGATSVNAQTTTTTSTSSYNSYNSTPEASFGVKGGFNISNMYTENADDENVLYGFNAGVYATFPLSDIISIQPELYYTTKGSELDYNNAFISGSSRLRLDYIQLPIMAKFNIGEHFNVHLGPYGAFLVGANVKSENDADIFEFDENLDTDDFEKFEFGLAAGVEFAFDPLTVGLRYDYGLTTVGKEQNFAGENFTFPDAKNSLLNVYLTYKLN